MDVRFVHTNVRVRDIDASMRFYEALGFERRGRLQFEGAYNIYLGLPGDGDTRLVLFFVRFDITQPANVSNKEIVEIWIREAEAALGAKAAGAVKHLRKVAGRRVSWRWRSFPPPRSSTVRWRASRSSRSWVPA